MAKYMSQEKINDFINPPIGTPVQWYHCADQGMDQKDVKAAIVTGHEGAGIVSLTILGRLANPQFKIGVRYLYDPFHKDMKELTMRNGGWSYVPGYEPREPEPQRQQAKQPPAQPPQKTAEPVKS